MNEQHLLKLVGEGTAYNAQEFVNQVGGDINEAHRLFASNRYCGEAFKDISCKAIISSYRIIS